MSKTVLIQTAPDINGLIYTIRDQKVIVDADLAIIYGVRTKRLNEQVNRNALRFPDDFRFRLNTNEAVNWFRSRSQIATLKQGQNIKYLPWAFTEHGALMAANVLNSPRAVEMSVYVIRAFVKMRAELTKNQDLTKRLAVIEKTLIGHDAALRDLFEKIRPLLLPSTEPNRREIGFHVKPVDPIQPKGKRT